MRTARVEQEVINRLYPGSWRVTELVSSLAAALGVSVQGVYKAIRKLHAREVVTVHNKQIALSGVWIAKEKAKLGFAEEVYKSADHMQKLVRLEKSKIVYRFKTLAEVDLFWTHSYFQLAGQVPETEPTYSVQPHDWYLYVRGETDSFWITKHTESKRLSRTLLTHADTLDREVMKLRKKELGKLFEFTLFENPLKQDSKTYYTLLGPYVFKVVFDPEVATRLNSFISQHDHLPLTQEAQREINEIMQMKGKFRLTIEKSENKAARLIGKCRKYFEF